MTVVEVTMPVRWASTMPELTPVVRPKSSALTTKQRLMDEHVQAPGQGLVLHALDPLRAQLAVNLEGRGRLRSDDQAPSMELMDCRVIDKTARKRPWEQAQHFAPGGGISVDEGQQAVGGVLARAMRNKPPVSGQLPTETRLIGPSTRPSSHSIDMFHSPLSAMAKAATR